MHFAETQGQYLKIDFETEQHLEFETEDTMVDWNETPVFVLHVITPYANNHKVLSKIQWDMEAWDGNPK